MIPEIGRREWADIINGALQHKLTSLTLQMKVNELKIGVMLHQKSLNEAIKELYTFVENNGQKFQNDLNSIFNLT